MKWTDVTKGAPPGRGHYLVTSSLNYYRGGNMELNEGGTTSSIQVAYYDGEKWNVGKVIAWAELPEVYGGI